MKSCKIRVVLLICILVNICWTYRYKSKLRNKIRKSKYRADPSPAAAAPGAAAPAAGAPGAGDKKVDPNESITA